MRPLLVGEANLFPWPPSSAGGRLMEMLGMEKEEYMISFDRVNLFEGVPARWSTPEARVRANAIQYNYGNEVVFLLGARVARAFGIDRDPWSIVQRADSMDGSLVTFVLLPHPSGRCRAWNDKRSIARLRRLVDKYLRRTGVRHEV